MIVNLVLLGFVGDIKLAICNCLSDFKNVLDLTANQTNIAGKKTFSGADVAHSAQTHEKYLSNRRNRLEPLMCHLCECSQGEPLSLLHMN